MTPRIRARTKFGDSYRKSSEANPGKTNARKPGAWKSRDLSQMSDVIGCKSESSSTVISATVGDQILRLGGCHRKSQSVSKASVFLYRKQMEIPVFQQIEVA